MSGKLSLRRRKLWEQSQPNEQNRQPAPMYRCSFLTPGLRDVYDEQLRLLASEQRIKVEKKEAKKNGWSGGGEDGGETFMFGDVELVVVPYVANSLFKLWDLQRQLPVP